MFDSLPYSVVDTRELGAAAHVLLVVEDEPSIRRAFVQAFERVGFEVLQAAEYLVAAARSREPAPPVVLISGDLLGGTARARDLRRTVNSYLPKPLAIESLRLEVERHLAVLPAR